MPSNGAQRSRWAMGIIGIVLVAVVIGVGIWYLESPNAPAPHGLPTAAAPAPTGPPPEAPPPGQAPASSATSAAPLVPAGAPPATPAVPPQPPAAAAPNQHSEVQSPPGNPAGSGPEQQAEQTAPAPEQQAEQTEAAPPAAAASAAPPPQATETAANQPPPAPATTTQPTATAEPTTTAEPTPAATSETTASSHAAAPSTQPEPPAQAGTAPATSEGSANSAPPSEAGASPAPTSASPAPPSGTAKKAETAAQPGSRSAAVQPAPAPMKLALATGAVRSAVTNALAPVSCTLVRGRVAEPDGGITLTGVAGQGAPEASLHHAITDAAPTAAVDWRVASFDGPYCPVLNLLRPIAYAVGGTASGLAMALRNGAGVVKDGDPIVIDLQTPDFPAWILLDYFEHDGTVVHLYPTAKTPARSYDPDSRQSFGDPAAGGEHWEAGAPYGTDMIVAVASSAPLFKAPRKDLEQADAYLRALQAAVEAARRHDARLAVDAVVLKTGPRL
jgi:hypothetical protein